MESSTEEGNESPVSRTQNMVPNNPLGKKIETTEL